MSALQRIAFCVTIGILICSVGCRTLEMSASYERGNVKATATYNPLSGDTKLNLNIW